jgi:membrane-bound lytic murein transglycosylase
MRRLIDKSRMSGDVHVRFCESLRGQFPWATRLLILTKTRWQNRKAVKQLNQLLNKLKVEKHPDKTYIGKIEHGFDFLGYHFNGSQLTVARKTVEKHVLHWHQLYEQQKKKKATSEEMASILDCYVNRWQRWVAAGLQGIKIGVYEQIQYPRVLMPTEQ